MTRALPGKRALLVPARLRNPQHFHRLCTGLAPLRTSHPHVCAQAAGKQSCVGWPAAADRHGRRYLYARPARRVREAETRWSISRRCRVRTDVRRCRAHVVRGWEPSRESGGALVGTDMVKVLANRKPTTRCRWLPNSMQFIGCCGHSCYSHRRYLCDAGQQPIVGF